MVTLKALGVLVVVLVTTTTSCVATGPAPRPEVLHECLPPGVSLEGLRVVGSDPVMTEVGIPAWRLAYAPPGGSVKYLVYRVRGRAVAVDDHPGGPEPDWIELSAVTPNGMLRPEPGTGCDWVRATPATRDLELEPRT